MQTSGKWKYAPSSTEHGEGLVYTGDDAENADAHIATVSGGLGYVMEDGRCYESEANGRLIAAAPDLLGALVTLYNICVEHQSKLPCGDFGPAMGFALNAIEQTEAEAENVPCATCGRYDMPLHQNLQCPECKAESPEGIHTHPDMDK